MPWVTASAQPWDVRVALAFATTDTNGIKIGVYDGAFLTQDALPLPPATYRVSADAIATDGDGGLGVVFTDALGGAFFAERVGAGVWSVADLGVRAKSATLSFDAAGSPIIGLLAADSNAVLMVTRGIVGDYNGSGQVEQGDLNLVLNNWGRDTASIASGGEGVPIAWVNDRPTGAVDQAELNGVLNNWGNNAQPLLSKALGFLNQG